MFGAGPAQAGTIELDQGSEQVTDMHIDQKVLADLQEVMEDGYLQLLETFLEDSERRLNQLHGAQEHRGAGPGRAQLQR